MAILGILAAGFILEVTLSSSTQKYNLQFNSHTSNKPI